MRLAGLPAGRTILLGLGVDGTATYRLLRRRYPELPLAVADQKSPGELAPDLAASLAQDRHTTAFLGQCWLDSLHLFSVCIKSPGISILKHRQLGEFIRQGGQVLGSTDLFLAETPARVIGVTGTKGKSTTATLLHRLLEAAGQRAHLVGNVGTPALAQLEAMQNGDWAVVEFSSYQCATLTRGPSVAVFVSLFPDHMDHHGGFERYAAAKARLTLTQDETGVFVYNGAEPRLTELAAQTRARGVVYNRPPGLRLTAAEDRLVGGAPPVEAFSLEGWTLPGRHNAENLMAALSVVRELGIALQDCREAVRTFEGLPHRLQRIATVRGVDYFDDAISTTPESTMRAVEVLGSRLAGVILGGTDRGYAFEALAALLARTPVQAAAYLPDSGSRLRAALEAACQGIREHPEALETSDMAAAVRFLARRAAPGQAVLLSTASPSYSLYADFKAKGAAFRTAVEKLKTEK
jgi:UDP-N-acetylmuramoyl-L-alanine---L-glutamate ligase